MFSLKEIYLKLSSDQQTLPINKSLPQASVLGVFLEEGGFPAEVVNDDASSMEGADGGNRWWLAEWTIVEGGITVVVRWDLERSE